MTISQVVVDYSQPVQSLFEQPTRVGSIHSVFNRAVNIAVDGTILALLSDELPRMPNGVQLPSAVVEELVRGIRVGMGVWVGDGRLLIPGCDFSLCLPEAPPWEPRPDMEGYRWQREMVAQHMRLIARYLADRPQRGGLAALVGPLLLEPTRALPVPQIASLPHTTPTPTGHSPGGMQAWEMPLARMALPKLRLLARAAWEQDMVGVEEATRGLAGLGPGLTPAGDDVLAGFAAVMTLLSARISADGVPRSHVAEVIAAVARPRTTMLSWVLLEHAARGEVAERLGEMLLTLALPAEEPGVVLHAADKLLAFGWTSGGDTLLGVLLGLRTLEGEL